MLENYKCPVCGGRRTTNEKQYSLKKYGKDLCYKCQQWEEIKIKDKEIQEYNERKKNE